jgi:peroxiredoxin Q/BCP
MKTGDEAPRFEMAGSDGKTHRLDDHLGRRVVVVAWFPRAFTPG